MPSQAQDKFPVAGTDILIIKDKNPPSLWYQQSTLYKSQAVD